MNIPPVIIGSSKKELHCRHLLTLHLLLCLSMILFFPPVAADYCSVMPVAVQVSPFLSAAAVKESSCSPEAVKDSFSLL